jgi:hypothetical protein
MEYNSPKFKKKVKSLQGKDLKTVQAEPKVEYTSTKQIGPYNTPTGFPEEQADKEAQPQLEKPKNGILNKIGSSIKKYIPLKKFMEENYLQEKKQLGVEKKARNYSTPMDRPFEPSVPTTPQGGFSIPFATPAGGIVPMLPDIIDFGEWLIQQQGNQSGENPIILPGVPQGGGGVQGQQPMNPNY